ncbi:MAG: putative transposase [Actinomycetia bacterium]|nr:putative transposase [Actinomycetes bacterium]
MQPKPWPEVPAATARVARKAFRKGSLAIRARDELGAWYADGDFAAAYGVRGAPGMSPAQLAMVTVLQFCENLTDRQAADAVRGRLDWKYALGLPLDDEGFDFPVLSEFRSRLAAAGLERALFELLLDRLKELGLVRPGGTQRTDSTHVLGAIRDLNRLELAGETVRAALETLAAAAPGWLAAVIDASWQEVYGQRIDGWRLPASETRRQELARQYGRDGYHLLEAALAPGAPGWLRELPAVEVLRQVWVQQYTRDQDGTVNRREAGLESGLPPGRSRITSPYDTGARYSQKRGKEWRGYKVHLTETCTHPGEQAADARPGAALNLITNVATTAAAVPDAAMTGPVHDMLAAAGLTPGEHAADAGYAGADLLLDARARGITLLAPLAVPSSPQARAGGYTADMFTIDWQNQQVTCPQGAASRKWSACRTGTRDGFIAGFPAATCRSCPARDKCTTSTRQGRQLFLRPREICEAVTVIRASQSAQQWKDRYAIRAGVEATIRQATAVTGIRTARYRGLPKTSLEHAAAAAINLIRLDAWHTARPLDRTRTTCLQRLTLTTTA